LKKVDILPVARANFDEHANETQLQLDARSTTQPFKVGDLVGTTTDAQRKRKEDAPFEGPYKITEVVGHNSVVVDSIEGPKRVNIDKLKLYSGDLTSAAAAGQHLPTALPFESDPTSWMDPPPSIKPAQLLTKRVRVYWNDYNKWFTGTVVSKAGRKHLVRYDVAPDGGSDPDIQEGLTLPKKRPRYQVLRSDFGLAIDFADTST